MALTSPPPVVPAASAVAGAVRGQKTKAAALLRINLRQYGIEGE